MDLYNGQLPDMLHQCGEDELSSSTPDRVMFIFIGDEDFLDLLQEMKDSYVEDGILIGYERFKILKKFKLLVAKLSDIVSSGESNLIAFLEKQGIFNEQIIQMKTFVFSDVLQKMKLL